jgi:hypothetical protein
MSLRPPVSKTVQWELMPTHQPNSVKAVICLAVPVLMEAI